MKKTLLGSVIAGIGILVLPVAASAHVVVSPSQAGVGQELVFHVSVPNERQSAVTSVKLDMPNGIDEVTPTVTPGWTITTTDSNDNISTITWAGTIPVGQREDFSFGAQMPADAAQLHWKAFQSYADGTIVHWDQQPSGSDDAAGSAGPYSVTKVVNDLASSAAGNSTDGTNKGTLALVLSIAALLLSIGSLFLRRKS